VPLTSVRLIVLAALLTAGALAATVLVWRRWGRWRLLSRPAGVLLTEVLLTMTVGLVVNRSQEFYPSWAALLASSEPGPNAYHTAAGKLDSWLAAQPDAGQAQSFPWRPSGWTAWRLAGAPTVTVPAGYLAHPTWRYSAVLVIGAHPWTLPPSAGPTVLVNVTTTAHTAASALAVAVPGSLGQDLRVTAHRWALVTSAADNALARAVVTAARGQFPAVAFVGTAAPAPAPVPHPVTPTAAQPTHAAVARPPASHPPATRPPANRPPATHPPATHPPATRPPANPAHPQHRVGPSRAAGYDDSCPAVHRPPAAAPCPVITLPPGVLPSGIRTAYFPSARTIRAGGALDAALRWAAAQTPPPLAASAPEPTYLPPAPKRPHHAKPKSKTTRHEPAGGKHGSGQPRP
jgi:hypothetical protein